jgi:hypothetical protein
MSQNSLSGQLNVIHFAAGRPEERPEADMTKAYSRFKLSNSRAGGFVVGLSDFACLGLRHYDLAGYPYDDELEAIFSDWVTLGKDLEEARGKFEETSRRSTIKETT